MITVYTTQTCSYCVMVKKYLDMKKVEYKTVDVTNDQEKRQELLNKTGLMSVPVVQNGDKYAVGFNPAKLAEVLA